MVQRIQEFDTWQPGYGGAVVSVYLAGSTTLATLYTDEAMTTIASNPQTLASRSDGNGTNYGKFNVPIYVNAPYQININGVEQTGVIRPALTSLSGEDSSAATIKANGSSYAVPLADAVGRTVYAANYG